MLQVRETDSETVKNAGKGIRKAFKSVETVSLPNPGRGVTMKSVSNNVTFNGRVAKINCFKTVGFLITVL